MTTRKERIERNLRQRDEALAAAEAAEARRPKCEIPIQFRLAQGVSVLGYCLVFGIARWGMQHLMPQYPGLGTSIAAGAVLFVAMTNWLAGSRGGFKNIVKRSKTDAAGTDQSKMGGKLMKIANLTVVAGLTGLVIFSATCVIQEGFRPLTDVLEGNAALQAEYASAVQQQEVMMAQYERVAAAMPSDYVTKKGEAYDRMVGPANAKVEALASRVNNMSTADVEAKLGDGLSSVGVWAISLGVSPLAIALTIAIVLGLVLDPVWSIFTFYTNLGIYRIKQDWNGGVDADELTAGGAGTTRGKRKPRHSKSGHARGMTPVDHGGPS